MTKDVIMYDKILSAQTYLELITGNYYSLNADNQVKQVENILDEQFGQGAYRNFALDNITEVIKNDHKVVLVEIVNIVMEGDEAEQDNIYRWFEVPDDWTKEDVLEQLKKVGLISSKKKVKVKIIGNSNLKTKGLKIFAHKFTNGSIKAIQASGCEYEVIK